MHKYLLRHCEGHSDVAISFIVYVLEIASLAMTIYVLRKEFNVKVKDVSGIL